MLIYGYCGIDIELVPVFFKEPDFIAIWWDTLIVIFDIINQCYRLFDCF